MPCTNAECSMSFSILCVFLCLTVTIRTDFAVPLLSNAHGCVCVSVCPSSRTQVYVFAPPDNF
jgi:hypothetical protein